MRKRHYWVILYTEKDEKTGAEVDKYHSRTTDRTESIKTLDSLLKTGVRAFAREEWD